MNSSKNDLTSINSNYNYNNNSNYTKSDIQSVNQSLINLIYGNKKNDINTNSNKSDIFSTKSNNANYINDNTIRDNDEINLSLLNLIQNRNDIISNKSNGISNRNEVQSLNSMFRELNNKIKVKEINKKVLYSGFVNMLEDNSKLKNIKHVNIITKNNKNNKANLDDNYKLEKLYVYKNKGIINNNENMKNKLTMKKILDDDKYYFFKRNMNNKINTKVHKSKLFKNRNKSVDSDYIF
jgi:hypothetical protein